MNDRYQIKRKPGGYLRVDDLMEDRVDGYWHMGDQEWFDLQAFMEAVS
jgi:hypothetical protein